MPMAMNFLHNEKISLKKAAAARTLYVQASAAFIYLSFKNVIAYFL